MAKRALPNPTNDNEMTAEHYRVQMKFVAEYVATMNKVKGARAAGFMGNGAGVRADEIMAWPGTMKLIYAELEGYALEAQTTKRWMLAQLFQLYDIALTQEVVRAQDVLKILQAIGDHTGINAKDLDDKTLQVVIRSFRDKDDDSPVSNLQVPSGVGTAGGPRAVANDAAAC